MANVRVLVVDDSALMRRVLSEILNSAPGIEVVATASDPLIARDKIKKLNPDVLTLDVEMPRMDGLTFLRNIMRLRPMPVVMVSSLTERGADVTLQALEIGAVDFVTKPKVGQRDGLEAQADVLINKVKSAARSRPRPSRSLVTPTKRDAGAILPERAPPDRPFLTTDRIIAIGASTGGTEAIKDVLVPLGAQTPIILITQHIPPMFSASFAARLDSLCRIRVSEAVDGQVLMPGHAYVAPGDAHLLLARDGARYVSKLSSGPPVNRHRPSVDVLFRSVAQNAGRNAVGVLLTGMGDDGAQGLVEMRGSGAHTIAQDEATSVVWGMPGEAVKLDAAIDVLPLDQISARMMTMATAEHRRTSNTSAVSR